MITMIKRTLFCLAFILASLQASAEYVPAKIYIYGFCASFNDSTVYFTDVMEVDSAWVEKKSRFLYSRNNYSLQLKEYMKSIGVQNPTCMVSFAKTKQEADKKFQKLRNKYTKAGTNYELNTITESMFKFEVISAADDYEATHKLTKEEKKAIKEEAKKAAQKAKDEKKAKREKDKAMKAKSKKRSS